MKPLCFVLMPFGRKPTSDGRLIDFDSVYESLVKPAIADAGLDPLRADEEMTGGIIHKAMFERLVLCEHAVCDLTTANANVFYELGVRHAVRKRATQLVFAEGYGQLPFDVGMLRALPYTLDAEGKPAETGSVKRRLTELLVESMNVKTDSPLFQLLDGYPDISRLKTDVFRDRVHYAEEVKARLALARKQGETDVAAIEASLGNIANEESAVVVDLFLSYRAVKAWDRMIGLEKKMSPALSSTIMIREQLALALNRANRGDEAESALKALITEKGGSSETYGILGRVYKDRWMKAAKAGDDFLARGALDMAIDAYVRGFESDWRDAYPGVNAVTLMECRNPPDDRRIKLLPLVEYAVRRRIECGKPDYWDYATLLELSVLSRNQKEAEDALCRALSMVREPWETETTAQNMSLIRQARLARGERINWADKAEEALFENSKKLL